jgi:hypothetical protein
MVGLVHFKMYENIKKLLISNIPVFRLVVALTLLHLYDKEQIDLSDIDMQLIHRIKSSSFQVNHCMGCTVHDRYTFSACFETSNPINQLIRSIPISEKH